MIANSPLADSSALYREIEAACRERRALFVALGTVAQWSAALDETLIYGRLEPAVHAAKCLSAAFPTADFARHLCGIFERMPSADDNCVPFQDSHWRDVQIVRRDRTETIMFVFCGRAQRAGLPLCMIHRWFGRLPASLVYLRDFQNLLYLGGIGSLGQSRAATLASLRRIAASLGARRVLCYGNSGGVFAALHYGLVLNAEAVLCLSGLTNISPDFNTHLRSAASVARLNRYLPQEMVDLRSAYRNAKRPPLARIVYAEHNWDDRLHAEYMGDLPTVKLQPVPNTTNHNVITDLIDRGEYECLLDWLIFSNERQVPQSPAP
jgi:hypothetical protein